MIYHSLVVLLNTIFLMIQKRIVGHNWTKTLVKAIMNHVSIVYIITWHTVYSIIEVCPFTVDGELESIIFQCNELLDSQPSHQCPSKTWNHRMADLQSSWEGGRTKIFEILVGVEFLLKGSLCSVCLAQPAISVCWLTYPLP